MPHFTLPIESQGPMFNAIVGVSAPLRSALIEANQPIPNSIPVRALIDTGASCTCVDPSILQRLNLTSKGDIPVSTPTTKGTPVAVSQYDVSIAVPPANSGQPTLTFGTIPVACIELIDHQGFHVLIGRDILSHCLFVYNGSTGLFTLGF